MKLIESLEATLTSAGQTHLIAALARLDERSRAKLQAQIEALDFAQLAKLLADENHGPDWRALAAEATSPPAFRLDGRGARFTPAEAIARGEAALREGTVGAILVAGGQGTRLGFPHPKGMFDLQLPSGRTLFQIFADRILAIGARYGHSIPLYLMTSPATHDETVNYFRQHNNLGLANHDLTIFCQGTMPAVDERTGKLLLESPASLALSPDGHGGTLAALAKHGCLNDARDRGIEQLFYFQVDNPLMQICDPEFIGYHLLCESELSTQVVAKRSPDEKVGVVVKIGDAVHILEYSNLPDDAAGRRDDSGGLALWAGNTACHVFHRAFLERMRDQANSLPFHRANKKVTYVDEQGRRIEPAEPNAIKFERFIFDLLPHANGAIVVEIDAAVGFAPVKNASTETSDTPATARAAVLKLHRSWLKSAGAEITDNAEVEIGPTFALNDADVKQRVEAGQIFSGSIYLTRMCHGSRCESKQRHTSSND